MANFCATPKLRPRAFTLSAEESARLDKHLTNWANRERKQMGLPPLEVTFTPGIQKESK